MKLNNKKMVISDDLFYLLSILLFSVINLLLYYVSIGINDKYEKYVLSTLVIFSLLYVINMFIVLNIINNSYSLVYVITAIILATIKVLLIVFIFKMKYCYNNSDTIQSTHSTCISVDVEINDSLNNNNDSENNNECENKNNNNDNNEKDNNVKLN